MASCPSCDAEVLADANFCTSCGNSTRIETPVQAPMFSDDNAPTQVFDIPPAAQPNAASVAASLDVELVRCAACDAPNAMQRQRCGRCDEPLDVETVPALFGDDAEPSRGRSRDDEPTDPPVPDDEPTVPPRMDGFGAVGGDRPDAPVFVADATTVPPYDQRTPPSGFGDDDTLPPLRDATIRTPLVPVATTARGLDRPRDPTGQLPVIDRTVRRPEELTSTGAPSVPSSRRWPVVAAIIAAVSAGGVLGFAIATDTGPFSGPGEPEFVAAEHTDPPLTLGMTSASATSAQSGRPPRAAVDQDAQTAWVADDGDDVPALTIDLGQPAWLTDVVIATGEPSASGGPAGSGRITMAFLDIDGERVASLLLRDQPGDQRIRLVTPALADRVTITVEELGDAGPAAITELRLEGHLAEVADAATLS